MASLKPVDRMYLEQLLEMSRGYVLSFSNTTFEDFVRGSTDEDIYSEAYGGNGDSKANRLRAFWNVAPDEKVAGLLSDLLTLMIDNEKIASDGKEAARVKEIIADLGGEPGATPGRNAMVEVAGPERRAFVSYSVEKKAGGAAVKACLTEFGYSCFLAHDDLRVSEEWKRRILDELSAADVFVALLSKEFMASKWCGQELGFIVSRPEVLVIPLSLDGTTPYGFIEHLQGSKVTKNNLAAVLEEVLFRKRPRQMVPAQVERVRNASSFRNAEALVLPLVPHFAQFTDEEVDAFAHAVAENGQVWDAADCRHDYLPTFVRVNGSRISPNVARALLKVLPELEIPQARSRARARRRTGP